MTTPDADHPPARLIIYGATGFTGQRLVRAALAQGLRPLLAGRSHAGLAALARDLARETGANLPVGVARVDDAAGLARLLRGATLLLNAAGPYETTATPLVQACVRAGVHYTDVSGELPALRRVAAMDAEARAAGVMLMPAAGYAVAPSDALVARARGELGPLRRVRIALAHFELFAAGSAKSMLSLVQSHVRVRRGGHLVRVRVGELEADFDFGAGPRRCTAINWSDTLTAWHTAQVPEIVVYLEADAWERCLYRVSSAASAGIRQPLVQAWAGTAADLWFARQDPVLEARLAARERCMVVEATAEDGRCWQWRLTTPDPYQVTDDCALAIAQRVLNGQLTPGFATPGGVYGDTLLGDITGARLQRRILQQ